MFQEGYNLNTKPNEKLLIKQLLFHSANYQDKFPYTPYTATFHIGLTAK